MQWRIKLIIKEHKPNLERININQKFMMKEDILFELMDFSVCGKLVLGNTEVP